eukprot:1275161-Heterocapsa_arctica.AAC.1
MAHRSTSTLAAVQDTEGTNSTRGNENHEVNNNDNWAPAPMDEDAQAEDAHLSAAPLTEHASGDTGHSQIHTYHEI